MKREDLENKIQNNQVDKQVSIYRTDGESLLFEREILDLWEGESAKHIYWQKECFAACGHRIDDGRVGGRCAVCGQTFCSRESKDDESCLKVRSICGKAVCLAHRRENGDRVMCKTHKVVLVGLAFKKLFLG